MPDPAAGTWEAPGGHLSDGEGPRAAAVREFQEETGLPFPDGEWTGTWTAGDGIYQGFVLTIPREADLDIFARRVGSDPDGDVDGSESIAWWDPADLPGNPAIRPELAASLDDVLAALGCGPAPEAVTKADPKDRGPKGWPGWEHDLTAAAHWAAVLAAALTAAIGKAQAEQMARAWLQAHPDGLPDGMGKRDATDQASAWLEGWLDEQGTDLTAACQEHAAGIIADGWLIGGASAQAVTDDQRADWGGWQPGDDATARDRVEALGLGAGLGATLAASSQAAQAAQEMARGYVTQMARALADGTLAGLGAAALGGAVYAALDDQEYARGSVLGQLVIASAAAALAYYLMRQVQRVNFITAADSRVCVRCVACEAGSPYPLNSAPEVPQHPRCRCQITPA